MLLKYYNKHYIIYNDPQLHLSEVKTSADFQCYLHYKNYKEILIIYENPCQNSPETDQYPVLSQLDVPPTCTSNLPSLFPLIHYLNSPQIPLPLTIITDQCPAPQGCKKTPEQVAQITQEVCLDWLPQHPAKHLSHPNLSINTLTVCNHPTLTDPWGVE